jgi:RNA polymerase sigma factor (sigma-70 family)
MSGKALNGTVQRIRAMAVLQSSRGSSDRELLERFIAAQDEAAFTALVERHGAMVQRLCRRVLGDSHDADDACQATFLILARKASSVRKTESLASWLHGVAYRVSISLRRQRARRQRRERLASRPGECAPASDHSWSDFHAALDEELQRLPERYRAPLVLCYLEGKTRDEAAQTLGITVGALHGLVNRGRSLLRRRLTGRGLTLSGVMFAAALTETVGRTAPVAAMAVRSARLAVAALRGETTDAAPQVLSLVQEATHAMFMTKLKIGAALFLAAGILTAGAAALLPSVSLAQDGSSNQARSTAAPAPADESDEAYIRRLSKDLRDREPSPTEVHFFVNSKDGRRRQQLVELFIQERAAERTAALKQGKAAAQKYEEAARQQLALWYTRAQTTTPMRRLSMLQGQLYDDLSAAAKERKDVAAITQKYLDQLQEYVKAQPKNEDIADAMQQIELIYRSQGKAVEADAWRAKLQKEHPRSAPAQSKRTSDNSQDFWRYSTFFQTQNPYMSGWQVMPIQGSSGYSNWHYPPARAKKEQEPK